MRVGYGSWSLDVELGWNAKYDPECITITPNRDTASFQLSSSVKRDGFVTDDELHGHAVTQFAPWGAPSPLSVGKFRGFSVTYVAEAMRWRRFYLACENVLVFATFITELAENPQHELAVMRMLRSLQTEHADA